MNEQLKDHKFNGNYVSKLEYPCESMSDLPVEPVSEEHSF